MTVRAFVQLALDPRWVLERGSGKLLARNVVDAAEVPDIAGWSAPDRVLPIGWVGGDEKSANPASAQRIETSAAAESNE